MVQLTHLTINVNTFVVILYYAFIPIIILFIKGKQKRKFVHPKESSKTMLHRLVTNFNQSKNPPR